MPEFTLCFSNGYSANFPEAAAAKLDTMLALNMASAGLDAAHGGNVVYASPPGFVHTSYGCLGASNSRGAPPADLYGNVDFILEQFYSFF